MAATLVRKKKIVGVRVKVAHLIMKLFGCETPLADGKAHIFFRAT